MPREHIGIRTQQTHSLVSGQSFWQASSLGCTGMSVRKSGWLLECHVVFMFSQVEMAYAYLPDYIVDDLTEFLILMSMYAFMHLQMYSVQVTIAHIQARTRCDGREHECVRTVVCALHCLLHWSKGILLQPVHPLQSHQGSHRMLFLF
jgi:hypothetical protein